jgi:MFS family permease
MATPLGRRLILAVTLIMMAICLVVVAGFTWVFAPKLPGISLAWCLITLVLMCGALWYVQIARILGQHVPRYSGKAALTFRAGAPIVALIIVAAMIGWMAYAHLQEMDSPLRRMHWIVQLILFSAGCALLYFKFSDYRKAPGAEAEVSAEENARRREKLLDDVASLQKSPFFDSFSLDTTGQRLKHTLSWWHEELLLCVPERGFVLAESFMNHFLVEARRQFVFLDSLRERNERREDVLQEAERRTLEFINRTGRLSRQAT